MHCFVALYNVLVHLIIFFYSELCNVTLSLLHFIMLHYVMLHYVTLHYIMLRYNKLLHFVTLHYITSLSSTTSWVKNDPNKIWTYLAFTHLFLAIFSCLEECHLNSKFQFIFLQKQQKFGHVRSRRGFRTWPGLGPGEPGRLS